MKTSHARDGKVQDTRKSRVPWGKTVKEETARQRRAKTREALYKVADDPGGDTVFPDLDSECCDPWSYD